MWKSPLKQRFERMQGPAAFETDYGLPKSA
jgi:hypothetical protein